MRRLVYLSVASVPFAVRELFQLLEAAREANARRGVTGLLVHLDGIFLQCLEGPAAAVDDLMRRVRRDPRHARVTLLCDLPAVDARLFAGWSMGFVHMDAVEAVAPDGLIGNADPLDAVLGPGAEQDPAGLLLQHFLRANRGRLCLEGAGRHVA